MVDTYVGVVDTCLRAYGARGICDSSPIQRRVRDVHTIAQPAPW
ncbi:acyl-CoA dehydrogenase family protein [Streptomyces sp. NPDC001714]